jgi:hypothetical protein
MKVARNYPGYMYIKEKLVSHRSSTYAGASQSNHSREVICDSFYSESESEP